MAGDVRRKKDGERKNKKRQRMRDDVALRQQSAAPERPARDEVDKIKYKRGSAGDESRRGAP